MGSHWINNQTNYRNFPEKMRSWAAANHCRPFSLFPWAHSFLKSVTPPMVSLARWLRKTVSEIATAALATATTIDTMPICFGFFFMTCASREIAAMFGNKKGDRAPFVLCDLLRLCVIAGLLIPAIFLPCAKPLMSWFGAEDDVVQQGFDYLVPICSCSFVTCTYLLLCGVLQAEGRTYLFGMVQVAAMLLNACVFDPLFLLGLKVQIRGASISIVLSQALPAVCLLIAFFSGKFTVKPKLSMLLAKPVPETWSALKTGFPSLISAVSSTFPSLFFQKFMGSGCENADVFNVMMNLYNAYNRIYQIAVAIFLALTSGFLPAGSYAYSSGRPRRVLWLLIHCFWLATTVALVFEVVMFSAPKFIAGMLSEQQLFMDRFVECLPKFWATLFACSRQYVATTLLQACKWQVSAIVLSVITQLLMWPILSCIFYFTNKEDEVRLFYACMFNDLVSVVVCIPPVVQVVRCLIKEGTYTVPIEDQSVTDMQEEGRPEEEVL